MKLIEQSLPYGELFYCNYYGPDDLEAITNPILYQNGVQTFFFHNSEIKSFGFTDKFLSNISKIKPKNIAMDYSYFEYKSKFNLIDILSQLHDQMTIKFDFYHRYNSVNLTFSNTTIKIIQNDRDDFMMLKLNHFKFQINHNDLKNIRVINNSKGIVLDIKDYLFAMFGNFIPILDQKKIIEFEKKFFESTPTSESAGTIIALVKDLTYISFDGSIFDIEDPDETVKWLLSKASGFKNFTQELNFPRDYSRLLRVTSLLHKNGKYALHFNLKDIKLGKGSSDKS